jgi:hypothetical protein
MRHALAHRRHLASRSVADQSEYCSHFVVLRSRESPGPPDVDSNESIQLSLRNAAFAVPDLRQGEAEEHA